MNKDNFNHPDSVKVVKFDGGFSEYNKRGGVTFTYKYRNPKSVRVEISEIGYITEYDQYDRITFWRMPSGFWSMCSYQEPIGEERPSQEKTLIIHKWWDLYNQL